MPAGTGLGQSSAGGMSPSELARLEYLEDNEYKVTYWASVSSNSGAVTKPTGSTIILDGFMSGVDAVVETIVNGQPSGLSPVTAGGSYVTVSSFDTSGNYTLSGTPSATPVALLYIVTIPGDQYQNLDNTKVVVAEPTGLKFGTPPIASEIVATDSNKNLQTLAVATYPSLTELSYVKNVTSAIQTQLNSKTSFLSLKGLNFSPADALTYYFVDSESPNTNATLFRCYSPSNIIITKAYVSIVVTTTLGSTETGSVSIRVDNTTDYLISNSVVMDATNRQVSNSSLNATVNAGSYFNIKLACPTWATNPTNVQINVTLEIKNN